MARELARVAHHHRKFFPTALQRKSNGKTQFLTLNFPISSPIAARNRMLSSPGITRSPERPCPGGEFSLPVLHLTRHSIPEVRRVLNEIKDPSPAIVWSYPVISIATVPPLGVVSPIVALAAEMSRGCWPGRETTTLIGELGVL